MRRAAEIIAFLGLSAMVHAGVMAGFGNSTGGPQAQGQAGADRITLTAAPESMAALAAKWAEPPLAVQSPSVLLPPQIAADPVALRLEQAAPSLSAPTAPPAPSAEAAPLPPRVIDPAPHTATEQSPRPTPRPDSAAQPARTAQGQGGGATSGSAPAPQPATAPDQGQRQTLLAQWGGQIMARIERARPRVTASGQVTLTLSITRGGDLAGLSVAQSSGDAALDQAALTAVRRAGRFPAAPDGLVEASYAFNLPIRFR